MLADDPAGLQEVARQIGLDILAVEVSAALSREKIPHAVIKGVTTSRWLYDPPRPYRDVDILVPGTRISDAVQALAGLAAASTGDFGEEAAHSQVLVARGGGEIDLHGTIPALGVDRADPDRVWRILGQGRIEFDLDGHQVPALSLPGRCLVLAMHVIASGHDSEQVREDLRRARNAVSPGQWAEAGRLATVLGLAGHFDAALDFIEGRSLEKAPREVRIRLAGGPATAIQVQRLLAMRRRDAIALLGREIWPTNAFMLRYDPRSSATRWGSSRARLRRIKHHVMSLCLSSWKGSCSRCRW